MVKISVKRPLGKADFVPIGDQQRLHLFLECKLPIARRLIVSQD